MTSPFLAALFLEFASEPSFFTVIVPSQFSVTIAGLSLGEAPPWVVLAAGGTTAAHPDKSTKTGNSQTDDSPGATPSAAGRFSRLFEPVRRLIFCILPERMADSHAIILCFASEIILCPAFDLAGAEIMLP